MGASRPMYVEEMFVRWKKLKNRKCRCLSVEKKKSVTRLVLGGFILQRSFFQKDFG